MCGHRPGSPLSLLGVMGQAGRMGLVGQKENEVARFIIIINDAHARVHYSIYDFGKINES